MTVDSVAEVVRSTVLIAGEVTLPILLATLLVGVLVAVLQTITQIQEQSIAFVFKLAAAAVVLLLGGVWMLTTFNTWVGELWVSIPARL